VTDREEMYTLNGNEKRLALSYGLLLIMARSLIIKNKKYKKKIKIKKKLATIYTLTVLRKLSTN
jgi:hypothetical protein